MKNKRLVEMLTPKPPFLDIIPRGAPIIINIIHANGIENFLCSSTRYVLIDFLYELINEKSLLIPRLRFSIRRLYGFIKLELTKGTIKGKDKRGRLE